MLNERHLAQHPGDTELCARIASYELAARMQLSAAEVGDLSKRNRCHPAVYGAERRQSAQSRFRQAIVSSRAG